ncbi:hypothetical protein EII19_13715, partial [Comamonadaceae bacterium OH2310_COT-174]
MVRLRRRRTDSRNQRARPNPEKLRLGARQPLGHENPLAGRPRPDHGSGNANTNAKTYHYIHSDHLGTPQIATDKNGNQTWAQVSQAFGKATISANASTEINIRFPGQYYDKETGTHYNFHRDYDPSTGRYLQSDP